MLELSKILVGIKAKVKTHFQRRILYVKMFNKSDSSFTLKVGLNGRDFRERQTDCTVFQEFVEILERVFKLEKPMLDYYKLFYKLKGKIEAVEF